MRTIQGRMLLRPSKTLNRIVLGVFGRAQRRYEMPIHALVVMSNHYHVLLTPPNAKRLSDFMRYVNTNLSKEVGKLHDWKGPMWQRRYDEIPVSGEEAAQIARLRYLLSHGCKENLVSKPREWPGVHSADAIVFGKPLKGLWIDRTKEFASKQRVNSCDPSNHVNEEEVVLTPLPACQHLTLEDYCCRVAELVVDIEEEARRLRQRTGTTPMGARTVMKMRPRHQPKTLESSPKPRFHAVRKRVRAEMEARFRDWMEAYGEASREWRNGNLEVEFPPCSFRPPSRWVGDDAFDTG